MMFRVLVNDVVYTNHKWTETGTSQVVKGWTAQCSTIAWLQALAIGRTWRGSAQVRVDLGFRVGCY